MSRKIPESREVWKHGEREFDHLDERLTRALCFMAGAGCALLAIWVSSVVIL